MRILVATVFLALATLGATDLSAQRVTPSWIGAATIVMPAEAEDRTERVWTMPVQGVSWHSRALSAIGGAALGAGVGYFASQIFRGDWDEEPGRHEVDRPTWAAVGGSIGLAVGLSFPLGRTRAQPEPSPAPSSNRRPLMREEMAGQGIRTAHDAVRLLRPEWLNERGVHIIGESRNETITVYLDNVRLGGVRTLRDVSIETIERIEYIDAAAATLRWGAGHSHGVIHIIARGGLAREAV